ncbi:hypothetical protein PLICRDRAFT_110762 [Plicaturopsis crispa FD-325 SS-3]|nr:hypothetical protein PLICRDRAFT_110762 [Plicaturopsis crispa FD-325 SS-3]
MSRDMTVTFLGTSSGGGPSESRNCSSLVADVLGNDNLWMVDCAEGTLRQFALQPRGGARHLKVNSVKKIFITHMHADHIMGIIPILRNVLFPPLLESGYLGDPGPSTKPPKIELYGPAGLRTFVRSIMKMTLTGTAEKFIVHELLREGDEPTPCEPDDLHESEVAGEDLFSDEDGFWREFTGGTGPLSDIVVDAGPISHRAPSFGYIIRETSGPERKLVVLGDTSDASAIIPLAISPSPSLVVHEATDAHIPRSVDPASNRTAEAVREKALARGHSVPSMAGMFAREVGAARLVLNHIGGRFPAPRNDRGIGALRTGVMREIERQASEAWGMGRAEAAWDFMQVVIPPNALDPPGISLDSLDTAMEVAVQTYVHTSVLYDRGGRGRGRGNWARGRGRGWRGGGGRGGGGVAAGGEAAGDTHSHEGSSKKRRR